MTEDTFSDLKHKIVKVENLIKDLDHFKSLITQNMQAFDKDDVSVIDSKISEVDEELAKLKEDLSNKEDIYHNTVTKLEKSLQQRLNVLEKINQETDLFEVYVDLGESFARKQAQLTQMLSEMKEKVLGRD